MEVDGRTSSVEIDDYVPLRFGTHDEPMGGGYVRLGNYSTTLVELGVEPHSQVLCRVVITAFESVSPWPDVSILHTREALPALSTRFQDYAILDLHENFQVSVRPREILLHWAPLGLCVEYQFGSVSFLAADDVLAGVWFRGLAEQDTRRFASHASNPQ